MKKYFNFLKKTFGVLTALVICVSVYNSVFALELGETVVGKGQTLCDTYTIDARPVYVYATAGQGVGGYVDRIQTGNVETYYDYHIYKATPKAGWKFVKWVTYCETSTSAGQNMEIGITSKWFFSATNSNTTQANVYSDTIRVNNGPDITDYSEFYRLFAIFSPIVTGTTDENGQIITDDTYTSYTDKVELAVPYAQNSENVYISAKEIGYEIDTVIINGDVQTITDEQRGYLYHRRFTNVTSPQSIHVTYRPVVYKINFNGNTSTKGSMAVQEFSYGTPEKLQTNLFEKDGYKFKNWNTASDGTGIAYSNEQEINNLTYQSGKTIELYAQWVASELEGTVNISGEEKLGKTLTATVKNTNNTGALQYQWKNKDGNISGATNSTYTLTLNDVGDKVTCVVTSTEQTGELFATSGVISDEYEVKYTLTNITSTGELVAKIGSDYTTILLPIERYDLPEQIIINIAAQELEQGKYTYNASTGEIVIPTAEIIGDIEIIAEAVKIPEYTVEVQAEKGVTVSSIEDLQSILEGTDVILDVKLQSGYKIKTVKINGVKQTLPLNKNQISIQDIRENITVTIETEKVSTLNNPQTGDNILVFVAVLLASILGIVVTTKYTRSYKNR